MSNVIIDFDGTIADSLPVVIKLFYMWSKREHFTEQEIENLRNMNLKDVIKAVGVPLWRVPSLLATARKDFTRYISDIDVFKGMPEAIAEMHQQGHKLYLMSSNSAENVRKFLKLHNIEQYFETVNGNTGLFGKASVMKSITKKYNIIAKDCYAIGDETRDIDAAKKAGLISIAVSWGYNGTKILEAHKPDYLISKPSEIIKLVK